MGCLLNRFRNAWVCCPTDRRRNTVSRNGGEENGGEESRSLAVRVERSRGPGGPEPACRFCPPVATGRVRTSVAVRTPAELVTVAADAHRDGVRRLMLSAAAPAVLGEYVRAVRLGLPALRASVVCRPDDLPTLGTLALAGVTDVDIHAGSLDDAVRARGAVAGTVLSLVGYERAWDEAVRVFGPFRVATCLAVGAGENPGELVAGAARLIARGVHPVVVPYQAGTDGLVGWVGHAVADMLRTVGADADTQPMAPLAPTTGWGMR